jgi:predicted nucleotidyltransferase
MTAEMLPLLTGTERRTLARYVETLRERLGPRLLGVRVFGSVAWGEAWPQGVPIRSDIDLLAFVRDELTEACRTTNPNGTLMVLSGHFAASRRRGVP